MITTVCPTCHRIRPCHCTTRTPNTTHAKRRRQHNNTRYRRKTAHWQRIRKARLTLAGHHCELRHPGCTTRADTVHLIGGGDHSKATLTMTRAACRHCHGVQDGGKRFFRDGRRGSPW